MPGPLVPILLGGGVLATLAILSQREKAALVPGLAPPPNFTASPPAAASIPPAGAPPGAPIITQSQFTALPPDQQAAIKQDALNGILTLTSTQGTLFADKNTAPPETLIGIFKPGDLNGEPRLKVTVDAVIGRRFGLDFSPVTTGNVILQTTGNDNGTSIPCVSVDPRFPGKTFLVPLAAINGAGDI